MCACAGDAGKGPGPTGASGVRINRDDLRLGLVADAGACTALGFSERHMAHLRRPFRFSNVHVGHCHVADSNVLLPDSVDDALTCDIRGDDAEFSKERRGSVISTSRGSLFRALLGLGRGGDRYLSGTGTFSREFPSQGPYLDRP